MMELLRSWLMGVTAAAILCALARALTPPGPAGQVGRLTAGLVMLLAVLRPLVRGEAVSPEGWFRDWQAQSALYSQELEAGRAAVLKTIIEEECAAYIVDKARELGAECRVQVTCREGEEGLLLPHQVQVEGELTGGQREALAQLLEEELAVPREGQTFLTEEGAQWTQTGGAQ